MSYTALMERLDELTKAAKNAKRPDSSCICAEHLALRKLAAPAYEMAACVTALIEVPQHLHENDCNKIRPKGDRNNRDCTCPCARRERALAALAKALGVSDE